MLLGHYDGSGRTGCQGLGEELVTVGRGAANRAEQSSRPDPPRVHCDARERPRRVTKPSERYSRGRQRSGIAHVGRRSCLSKENGRAGHHPYACRWDLISNITPRTELHFQTEFVQSRSCGPRWQTP